MASRDPEVRRAYYLANREREAARARAWEAANPERAAATARRRHRLREYGVTEERYAALLDRQGGACGICRNPLGVKTRIDHDHACCPGTRTCGKCTRGVLCNRCNVLLAGVEDLEFRAKALQYLEDWN